MLRHTSTGFPGNGEFAFVFLDEDEFRTVQPGDTVLIPKIRGLLVVDWVGPIDFRGITEQQRKGHDVRQDYFDAKTSSSDSLVDPYPPNYGGLYAASKKRSGNPAGNRDGSGL